MEKPLNILVTGAGLVAAHVTSALLNTGNNVFIFDRAPSLEYLSTIFDVTRVPVLIGDVTNLSEIAGYAQKNKTDCIIHTAALIGAAVSREPYRGVEINIGGSLAVIEAARLAGATRVLFCSSVAIYDFERLAPNTLIDEDAPFGPKNLYGATKLASEQLLTQYGALYGIDVVHLRLAGVYGRGQYVGGSWMGRILNRVLKAVLEGKPASLKPEWIGTQEYVYAKDVATAFVSACLAPKSLYGAYNIGTGRLHTYEQVATEIERIVPGAKIQIEPSTDPVPSYLIRTQPFDISKARTRLGYSPAFNLPAGLKDYIEGLRRYSSTYSTLD